MRMNVIFSWILACTLAGTALAQAPTLYERTFASEPLGRTPAGWRDAIDVNINPAWGIDGKGFLRPLVKNQEGMLLYHGALADDSNPRELRDCSMEATFKKTPDAAVSLSLVARARDAKNYYAARFAGLDTFEIVKVKEGEATVLSYLVTRQRYPDRALWRLVFTTAGDRLTARVIDDRGIEQSRIDAADAEFSSGAVGLHGTAFAAVQSFAVRAPGAFQAKLSPEQIAAKNDAMVPAEAKYTVLKPAWEIEKLNTPFDKASEEYDVVIAGAGCGGWAAAVQAARLGSRVLLLEESDWIGGQMAAAAVSTMDEEGIWFQFPVRERGIYREFHESMVNYYYTLDKDPFNAYHSWPHQTEGGYEPKATRAMMYAFIEDARKGGGQPVAGGGQRAGKLDLCVRTKVTGVQKNGDTITGATLETWEGEQTKSKQVRCKILMDATEYGDVIPLTGARYRVGNVTSDKLDPKAPVQDFTWTAVFREYPEGIPDHLKIKTKPPLYEKHGKRWRNYQLAGNYIWGGAGKGIKGPRVWRVFFSWRGMADADSPITGEASEVRHSQCGINGGNDYPATVATIEDPDTRFADERLGVHWTLCALYYFQVELGLPWSLAEDEGYNTAYNQKMMKARGVDPSMLPLAVHMPQHPYVRESRRAVGLYTLNAQDMGRFENAKLHPTSVAMGDYFMDLHRTDEHLETDLDKPGYFKGGGPFQVPFEVFVAEKIDGLMMAEKNISQSRLVSGATRLQPITMLTGQAAGAIAALAIRQGVPPRQVNPIHAQATLLEAGSTLIQRWYMDVPWNSPLWRATQLLSLYGVMDRPGPINKRNGPLRENWTWGPDEPLSAEDLSAAQARLKELAGAELKLPDGEKLTRGQFALLAARFLVDQGRPR